MEDSKETTAAVLYARYSPRFNGNESDSAEAQFARCEAYCEFNHWSILARYKDELKSGKDDNRPQFQEAIAMACKHKTVFVVYSLSRFSRNVVDSLKYADMLYKAGAQLVSIEEKIDTTSATGELVFNLLSVLNHYNRRMMAKTTSDAMMTYQYYMNLRMSDKVPFGTQIDPNDSTRLIENQSERAIINEILQMRAKKMTLRQISRRLWKGGFTGRRSAVMVNGEHVADRIGFVGHKTVALILEREDKKTSRKGKTA